MFHPLQTYFSFEPVENPDVVSKGGIVLPDQPKRARVVAVGPGKTLSNGLTKFCAVEPGQYVVFTSNAYIQELMISGERVYYCDSDFVAGFVDAEDAIERTPTAPAEPESKIVLAERAPIDTDLEFVNVEKAN